jgi:hypothetical protein
VSSVLARQAQARSAFMRRRGNVRHRGIDFPASCLQQLAQTLEAVRRQRLQAARLRLQATRESINGGGRASPGASAYCPGYPDPLA